VSQNFRQFRARFGVGWLLVCVFASTLSLVYQAISEWRRSAAMLAQRRAEAAVELLVVGSTRDMRRVQGTVLASLRFDEPEPDMRLDPYEVGSAFARYPYPEAFFAGFGQPTVDSMTFYVRGDRPPVWMPSAGPARVPVRFGKVPGIADVLLGRIAQDVANGRRFATFDIELHGIKYQVVALLSYSDLVGERLKGIVGFVVNLEWAKQNYPKPKSFTTASAVRSLTTWLLGLDSNPPPLKLRRDGPATLRLTG